MHTDERAFRLGASGERKVAARLERLGSEWRILHSIPVGRSDSDIDHVVIGPSGVYTINAKHHRDASVWSVGDAFMVNGQWVPYVRNARHEAARAGRLLSAATGFQVEATGVVVVVGARGGFRVKSQPEDGRVFVMDEYALLKWLKRGPVCLSAQAVERIYEKARRSNTWQRV